MKIDLLSASFKPTSVLNQIEKVVNELKYRASMLKPCCCATWVSPTHPS